MRQYSLIIALGSYDNIFSQVKAQILSKFIFLVSSHLSSITFMKTFFNDHSKSQPTP